MSRDVVWLVIVIILGGNTLVMLNSEEASDPNLIDIEELSCSLGEILVSNTSLVEGYECTEFDPHSIIHTHPAPVLSVSNVIDDGFTIAIFGDKSRSSAKYILSRSIVLFKFNYFCIFICLIEV